MIKKLSLLIFVLVLAGCVSTPPIPEFNLQKNARIGVMIDLDETIGHQHYAGLRFNNFSKVTKLNWNLNSFAKEEAKKLLQEKGYEYVELSSSEMALYKYRVFSLANVKDEKWVIAEGAETLYQNLKNDKKLDAIVAYKSSPNIVSVECSNLGCAEFSAAHSGLYSRGIPLLKKTYLSTVLPSTKMVTLLNPVADLGNYNNVYSSNHQLGVISGFSPNNIKRLSESEWKEVEEYLKEHISNLLKEDITKLSQGSKGNK